MILALNIHGSDLMSKHFERQDITNYLQQIKAENFDAALGIMQQKKPIPASARQGSAKYESLLSYCLRVAPQQLISLLKFKKTASSKGLETERDSQLTSSLPDNSQPLFQALHSSSEDALRFITQLLCELSKGNRSGGNGNSNHPLIRGIIQNKNAFALANEEKGNSFVHAIVALDPKGSSFHPSNHPLILAFYFKMAMSLTNPWENSGVDAELIKILNSHILSDPEARKNNVDGLSLLDTTISLLADTKVNFNEKSNTFKTIDGTPAISKKTFLNEKIPIAQHSKETITIGNAIKQAKLAERTQAKAEAKARQQAEQEKRRKTEAVQQEKQKERRIEQAEEDEKRKFDALKEIEPPEEVNKRRVLAFLNMRSKGKESQRQREKRIGLDLYNISSDEEGENNTSQEAPKKAKPKNLPQSTHPSQQKKTTPQEKTTLPALKRKEPEALNILGKPPMTCRSAVCSAAGVGLITFGTGALISGSFAIYYSLPLISQGLSVLMKSTGFMLFTGASIIGLTAAILCASFLIIDKCSDKKIAALSKHSITAKPKVTQNPSVAITNEMQ